MRKNMSIFLGGKLKGAPTTRERNLNQAENIQAAINQRWEADNPERWKVKHVRWFLEVHLKTLSTETRYRNWQTVIILMERLEKTTDWMPHLQGPWTRRSPKQS